MESDDEGTLRAGDMPACQGFAAIHSHPQRQQREQCDVQGAGERRRYRPLHRHSPTPRKLQDCLHRGRDVGRPRQSIRQLDVAARRGNAYRPAVYRQSRQQRKTAFRHDCPERM